MDKLIYDRLQQIQEALRSAHDASLELKSEHSAITGVEREIFVGNFLCEMFPPHFRFGSGVIIDNKGRKTGQLDIVIELPFSPSFTLGHNAPRIYFEEIIGAVIEVKSNLKTQWDDLEKQLKFRPPNEDGINKIHALKGFKRQVQVSTMKELSETIPAYAVGYKGFDSLNELKQQMNARNEEDNLWIRAALQVEPALFVAGGKYIDRYSCEGPKAFGAFIASLDFELQRVVRGHSKLWKHFGINSEST